MARFPPLVLAVVLAPAVLSGACASVLDIQKAELDPERSAGGKTGSDDAGAGGAKAEGSGGAAVDGGSDPNAKIGFCAEYCAAVMTNCKNVEGSPRTEQYTSLRMCLATCAQLPQGSKSDDSGNTIGCRLHYALAAANGSEPEVNCPAAGPGGDGVCGTYCENFCAITNAVCSAVYPSVSECLRACEPLPNIGPYEAKIQTGNSQQCRVYHSTAATLDRKVHCPHTDVTLSGTPCAPN